MNHIIRLSVIGFFCLTLTFSFGQTPNSNKKENKPYIVWVKIKDSNSKLKGYLSDVGDTLVISPIKKYETENRIQLVNVDYLQFRRKGKVNRSILIGCAAGFGLGALFGYVSYTPCSSSGSFCIDLGPGASALGGGIVGLIPGLIVGGMIGSDKVKIPIRSSKKSIQAQKEELMKYKFGG